MAEKPRIPRERYARWACLALLASCIAFARLHTYEEPFERDIAIYALIGQGLLEGRALYSDLWDLKPPGVYLAYAGAQAMAGGGRPGIFLLNVAMPFLALLGLARIGESMERLAAPASRRHAWAWTVALWCIVSGALTLQANQPNVEVFLNAGRIWFFALLFAGESRVLSFGRVWAAGFVLALTSLFKQVAVVDGVLLGAVLLAFPPGGPQERPRALRHVCILALAGVITWSLVFVHFALRGTFSDFYGAVFEFTRAYSGDLVGNLAEAAKLENALPDFVGFLWPLAALWALAMLAGPRANRRFTLALAAFSLGAWIEIALPGKFFPHYYQLWLPPLVVAAGWAICVLPFRALAFAAGAVALLVLCATELPSYRLPAEEWSRRKYGEEFILTARMGRDLRDFYLWPGETFYNWGFDPGLYFEAGVLPRYGVFFCEATYGPGIGHALQRRIVEDLERDPPELFVFSIDRGFPQDGPVRERLHPWLQENYQLLDSTPRHGKFLLYARKGSALQARWLRPQSGG